MKTSKEFAFGLKFPERVTFQLISFSEWRGRLPDNSPKCFRWKAGEAISAHCSDQQIQHLIAFMHPLHEEHIARAHSM
jgi:hypothetical protein